MSGQANSRKVLDESRWQDDDESYCPKCGAVMEWEYCWNGCDEGWHTDLYEQDPLWYDEGDMEKCDVCNGNGGWLVCTNQECPA